jgi:hypothetical protein
MTLTEALQLKSICDSLAAGDILADSEKDFIRNLLAGASRNESFDILMQVIRAVNSKERKARRSFSRFH